jgi:2-keto-3-deoxy-6-phosphogluconate aldolase
MGTWMMIFKVTINEHTAAKQDLLAQGGSCLQPQKLASSQVWQDLKRTSKEFDAATVQ